MSSRTRLNLASSTALFRLGRTSPQPSRRRVLCALLAVACLSPATGLADKKSKPPTTKTVTGQVQDPSEKTLGGAEVTLKDLQTGKVTMTQITEAVFTQGVLKPAVDLNLREQQRVRVIVEPIDDGLGDRETAVARLKAGIASMKFFSKGSLPRREDIHDRT